MTNRPMTLAEMANEVVNHKDAGKMAAAYVEETMRVFRESYEAKLAKLTEESDVARLQQAAREAEENYFEAVRQIAEIDGSLDDSDTAKYANGYGQEIKRVKHLSHDTMKTLGYLVQEVINETIKENPPTLTALAEIAKNHGLSLASDYEKRVVKGELPNVNGNITVHAEPIKHRTLFHVGNEAYATEPEVSRYYESIKA